MLSALPSRIAAAPRQWHQLFRVSHAQSSLSETIKSLETEMIWIHSTFQEPFLVAVPPKSTAQMFCLVCPKQASIRDQNLKFWIQKLLPFLSQHEYRGTVSMFQCLSSGLQTHRSSEGKFFLTGNTWNISNIWEQVRGLAPVSFPVTVDACRCHTGCGTFLRVPATLSHGVPKKLRNSNSTWTFLRSIIFGSFGVWPRTTQFSESRLILL